MNLADLANLVCTKIGKTDDDSVAACKTYLQQRHEMIVDAFLWRDTLGIFEVEVEAEATTVVLPWEAAKPIAAWDSESGLALDITSLMTVAMVNPGSLTTNSALTRFVEIESVGWAYPLDSDAGSQLSFINTGDEEATINISGERDLGITGIPTLPDATTTETVTVAASGGQAYSSAWKVIHRMTKNAVGPVAIAQIDEIPEPTWAWPADSKEASFARLRLIHPPIDAMTLGLLAKRRLRQMLLDTDGPMVRGIDNCLIAFAQADMLERSRQYAKATEKRTEGTTLLGVAKEGEVHQSATEARLIPAGEVAEGDNFEQW